MPEQRLHTRAKGLFLPAVLVAGSCENEYYVRYAPTCAYRDALTVQSLRKTVSEPYT